MLSQNYSGFFNQGGTWYIEGFKASSTFEWQSAKKYASAPSAIFNLIRSKIEGNWNSWYKDKPDPQWERLTWWLNNVPIVEEIESRFVATTEWTEFKYMSSASSEIYIAMFRRKLTGVNSGFCTIGPTLCHIKRSGDGIWYAKTISNYIP